MLTAVDHGAYIVPVLVFTLMIVPEKRTEPFQCIELCTGVVRIG